MNYYFRKGEIVAIYDKKNLFMSETKIFNEPNLEVVTFDTDFGRFGLMTCFDAMYSHPFLDLVESQDLGIMCLCLAIGVGGNNRTFGRTFII